MVFISAKTVLTVTAMLFAGSALALNADRGLTAREVAILNLLDQRKFLLHCIGPICLDANRVLNVPRLSGCCFFAVSGSEYWMNQPGSRALDRRAYATSNISPPLESRSPSVASDLLAKLKGGKKSKDRTPATSPDHSSEEGSDSVAEKASSQSQSEAKQRGAVKNLLAKSESLFFKL